MELSISDQEFDRFRKMFHDIAGIALTPNKKPLVSGRLMQRLRNLQLTSFMDYYEFLASGRQPEELQTAIDLLTTNETYFFREPKHFSFLRENILAKHPRRAALRVWSAACSSGEEPYSLAMLLADILADAPWEVLASDISTRVLSKAQLGHYPISRSKDIPQDYLSRYCLKGVGTQAGTFLIESGLRQRVNFMQVNLNKPLPNLGPFDIVFLRNVMIYFDMTMKSQVIARLAPLIRPGGHLMIGHSETLQGINTDLAQTAPSIYRKPDAPAH